MQKLVIFLSCLVCLTVAGRLAQERKPWSWQNIVGNEQQPTKWEISEEDVRGHQKFLLDVLLQVQKPLVNTELIELGKVLINDPAAYIESEDKLLWEFLEHCREHEVLGRDAIYTQTNMDQVWQMVGLTKFLTLAKDWPTFQRNVCFARLHINPIMFVNALLMAVHEREDTRCLIMPAMHEILPQLFYDKDVILTAENVEWLDLVSKTTTTKPSMLNIVGLGNMLSMISPIHWVSGGKASLWRPWHQRHMSPINARKIQEQMEVEIKDPITEKMGAVMVGQMGTPMVGPIVGPIGVTWHTQLNEPKPEDQTEKNILVQSEEKLIIPVEQPNSLSYLTDDVGLNSFWNHAMNQRLVETVTGDKHHKLHRLGVEKTMPWEKQWKNHGKWERVEGRNEEKRHTTEWQPREWVRQEIKNQGRWERAEDIDNERRHTTEWHPEMTKTKKQQRWNEELIAGERDAQTKQERTNAGWRQHAMGHKWRMPQEENVEEIMQNERRHEHNSVHNSQNRRQNWQRPSWWQKRQNVPEMSERTEKRWNSHVPEVVDDEVHQGSRGRWSNIRNGRVVVEEVKPWTTDRLDRQHTDGWLQHTDNWLHGEQKPNRGNWLKSESNKDWNLWQQRNPRITEGETDNGNVNIDHEGWANKRNGWAADLDTTQWQSRDQPWRRDWVEGTQRKVNDDDWLTYKTTTDDEWIKSQRTNVDDKDDIEVGKDWQKSWQDRRIIDGDRLMSTTTNDADWMNSQRRPIVGDRDDVEVGKKWENRRPMDSERWMSRATNDDDWSTPQHERRIADDDKETRHSRIPRSIKTVDISPEQELMNVRRGEILLQNIQQLLARIHMEKISLAETMETKLLDEQIWRKPQLITTSGKLYQHMMVTPAEAHWKIKQSIQKLNHFIDNELKHAQMRPNHPEFVKMIGEILIQANGELGNVCDELYNDINMAVFGLESSSNEATVLSIPSGVLREPIYQDILTSLNQLIWHYKQQLQPYNPEQLLVPGIHVDHVEVDDLVTYFDVTDGDLINLVDQQLLQFNVNNMEKLEKQLVARQQRLNHKQFTLSYDIAAELPQRVVVRTFLGPKIDEHGRPLPLEVARQDFMLLDAFVQNLIPGGNHIERNSRDIVWTTRDTSSLNEIYRRVMQHLPMHELVSSNCRYPHRLLLPRGTPSGLPMQLLVVVTPVTEEDRVLQELINPDWLCGLGIAAIHLDTLPLDYPLDRTIENVSDFLQPNMLLKDVLIMHDEHVEVPRV